MAAINVTELATVGRRNRRPVHTFHLRFKPFVIQPFCIAPVLPGETLRLALLQSRVVSDVVKNPLIGWWYEKYLFYVKHRDLDGRTDFTNMVLQQGYSLAAYNRAATVDTYHNGPGIDWAFECLKRITEVFFRNQGEAWNVANGTLGGMPLAKLSGNTYIDSVVAAAALDEGGSPQSGTETLQELDKMLDTYEFMRSQKLTNLTYEQWLRTYGVKSPKAEMHEPELIRYVRDWSYPANTVDPATGVPSSALSWSLAERVDKDRFFPEPGFVFGVAVCRPKVYLSKLTGAAANAMVDALTWLPAIMRDNPETSLIEFANGTGPVRAGGADGYWLDIRDLLLYGDQFVNIALSATDINAVALPTAAYLKDYVASADIDALFVNAAGGKNLVKCDGVINFTIAGTQADNT